MEVQEEASEVTRRGRKARRRVRRFVGRVGGWMGLRVKHEHELGMQR